MVRPSYRIKEMVKFYTPLEWSLKLLNAVGLNPFRKNIFSNIRWILMFISLGTITLFNFPIVILNWRGLITLDDVVFLPPVLMVMVKIYTFTKEQKQIYKLLLGLENFWPLDKFGNEHKEKMEQIIKSCLKLFKLFIGIISINIICVQPLLYYNKELLFPMYYTCEINRNSTLCYHFHNIWYTVAVYGQVLPLYLGSIFYFASIVTYIYVMVEMIKSSFNYLQLVPRSNHDIHLCKANLKDIVNQHNLILSFIKEVNDMYLMYFLLQFWIGCASMVFVVFMLTLPGFPPNMDHLILYMSLLSPFIFELYSYAIGGSLIYAQTLSVAQAAYNTEWYQVGQSKLRSDLALVIQRSYKVERLRVGNISDLDLILIAKTMKAALSVYTLLLTVQAMESRTKN